MVSVAVVGPAMSGKTHLCMMMSGLEMEPRSAYNETCSTGYLKVDINNTPWHVWDTPRYEDSGWVGDNVVDEADVVVVCHDGSRDSNPCRLVRIFGVDKCVIALTRQHLAGANMSWAADYFRTLTSSAALIPILPAYSSAIHIIHYISQHYVGREDSEEHAEYV